MSAFRRINKLAQRASELSGELALLADNLGHSEREDLFEKACAVADFLRRSDAAGTPCLRELIELCDRLRGKKGGAP